MNLSIQWDFLILQKNKDMAKVKVPKFQVIFDEDGFYYINKITSPLEYIKIEKPKYITFEEAKAIADDLNSFPENPPLIVDLEID